MLCTLHTAHTMQTLTFEMNERDGSFEELRYRFSDILHHVELISTTFRSHFVCYGHQMNGINGCGIAFILSFIWFVRPTCCNRRSVYGASIFFQILAIFSEHSPLMQLISIACGDFCAKWPRILTHRSANMWQWQCAKIVEWL